MNTDEELNRFFKSYSTRQRQKVEADLFYQKAIKEGNVVKAIEIASEHLVGNAKDKQQQRKLLKQKRRMDEISEFI